MPDMTTGGFMKAWPLLRRRVARRRLPWVEDLARRRRDPFKVLISCILSLRTQDRTTAAASQRLFRAASAPRTMARLSPGTIEKLIYPVGFYRVKARTVREISREILMRYGARVPDTLEELLALKGVGRKTANLVLTRGFGKHGICVDTHVHRIANRWGLVRTTSPDRTETALRETLPKRYWKELNGVLVAFGQGICQPVSPRCSGCDIASWCGKRGVTRSR